MVNVRLYRFDPQACTALPPSPPVGIPSGMPFLLDDDGVPVEVANRWLRSLPTTGVPAAKSWVAYGEDLKAWAQFLRARSLQLIDDPGLLVEAVAAYHADRRMGPLDRRLAETSWNRAVAAIARFYEWAQTEGMTTGSRFPTARSPSVAKLPWRGQCGATWPRSAGPGPT